MMNFKSHKKPGFSLIEVMLALAMFGVTITVLLSLEGTLLSQVFNYSRAIDKIIAMKNFFYEMQQEEEHAQTRELGNLKLTYSEKNSGALNEKSPLKKIKNLIVVRVDGTLRTKTDSLITFIYQEPEVSHEADKARV